jgi:hypothetical protein
MGLEMNQRGNMKGLVTRGRNGSPYLLAFVWGGRERRCFIASGSSLEEGASYAREVEAGR